MSIAIGTDAYGTVRTAHVLEGKVVHQDTYDAEPLLKEAHDARVATQGQRWGEGVGTRVGTIPMAVYSQYLKLPALERQIYLAKWLRDNPAFVTFDKFLK